MAKGTVMYVLLSIGCFAMSYVEEVPRVVEAIGRAVIPFTFFLLGPPIVLVTGRQGIPVYVVETLILVALVWFTVKRTKRTGDVGVSLLVTIGYWILCGFSLLIAAM